MERLRELRILEVIHIRKGHSIMTMLILSLLFLGCTKNPTQRTDSLLRIQWETRESSYEEVYLTSVMVMAWQPKEDMAIGIDYRVVHLNAFDQVEDLKEGIYLVQTYVPLILMFTHPIFTHPDSIGTTFEYRFILIEVANEREIETNSGTYNP